MPDKSNDLLQKRQPTTLATYKNYKFATGDEISFPDFSKKMSEPDYVDSVFSSIKSNDQTSKNLDLDKETFANKIMDETWAWNEDAQQNEFYTKDAVDELNKGYSDIDKEYAMPPEEKPPEGWFDKMMFSISYGDNMKGRAGLYYANQRNKAAARDKLEKSIYEKYRQKALSNAADNLAMDIKPTDSAQDIIFKFNKEIGFSKESINRESMIADGVYRARDEAAYINSQLNYVWGAVSGNINKIEGEIGSEKVKQYIDDLSKFSQLVDEAQKLKDSGDQAGIQELVTSDEYKEAFGKIQTYDKDPRYANYLKQQLLGMKVAKSFKDIENIDKEWWDEQKEKKEKQEQADKVAKTIDYLAEKHPYNPAVLAQKYLSVGSKEVVGSVLNTATDILSIPNNAAALFKNSRGYGFELARWAEETFDASKIAVLPTKVQRGIYENVVKVEHDGKEYEAVVNNGVVTSVYDDQGYAVDGDMAGDIAGKVGDDPKTEIKFNGLAMFGHTVRLGADLAIMMAGAKGLTGALTKTGKAFGLGAGFTDFLAPRIGVFGAMSAQFQNEYYQEAVHSGMSPKEAAWFSLMATTAVSSVGQFNPQLFLMNEGGSNLIVKSVQQAVKHIASGTTKTEAFAKGFQFLMKNSVKQGIEMSAMIPAENFVKMSFNGLDPRNKLALRTAYTDYLEMFTLGATIGLLSPIKKGRDLFSRSRISKEALYAGYKGQKEFFELIDKHINSEGKGLDWSIDDAENAKEHFRKVFEITSRMKEGKAFSEEESLQLVSLVDEAIKTQNEYTEALSKGDKIKEATLKPKYDETMERLKRIQEGDKSFIKAGTQKDFSDKPELDPKQKQDLSALRQELDKEYNNKYVKIGNNEYRIVGEDESTYQLESGTHIKKSSADRVYERPENILDVVRKRSERGAVDRALSPEGIAKNRKALENTSRLLKDQGINIVVLNDAEYSKKFGDSYGANVKSGDNETIYVNSEWLKDNTIFHEANHSILSRVEAKKPGVIDSWYNDLGKSEWFTWFDEFGKRSAEQGDGNQKEEAVAEFMSQVAAGNVPLEIGGVKDALYDMYRSVFGKYDINVDKATNQDLMQFARNVAMAYRGGGQLVNPANMANKQERREEFVQNIRSAARETVTNENRLKAVMTTRDQVLDRYVSNMGLAEDMLSSNIPANMVSLATGYRVENGQLVSDIGDHTLKTKVNKAGGRAEDILDFPQLFDEFKGLGGIPVSVDIGTENRKSYSSFRNGKIHVWANNDVAAAEEIKKVLRDFVSENPMFYAKTQKFQAPINLQKTTGTGQESSDFFKNKARKSMSDIPYEPTLNIDQNSKVAKDFKRFTGNGAFTGHISKMIPTFQEKQILSIQAVTNMAKEAKGEFNVLDIGTSEGGYIKTVAANGKNIKAVGIDPNPEMMKNFKATEVPENAEYRLEALGASWVEDDGTVIKEFKPKEKYDVVNEDFVFQYINNDRVSQVENVKKVLKKGGLFVTSERFHTENWDQNEKVKEGHQRKYFNDEIINKSKATLPAMLKDMVYDTEYLKVLRDKFKYVAEWWNAGNYKGYVASDSKAKIDKYLKDVGDTSSEYTDTQSKTKGLWKPGQEGPAIVKKQVSTDTDNFKKWFKKSKVVDESGKPQVVYHGTDEKFDVFEGYDDMNYFTDNKEYAEGFGDAKSFYLNIQKPLDMATLGEKEVTSDEFIGFMKENGIELSDDEIKRISDYKTAEPWMFLRDNSEIVEKIRKAGFDGVKQIEGDGKTAWVAFDPKQIKSTENNGDFDPNNPSVKAQGAWHGSPYDFDEFKKAAIGSGQGAQSYGYGLYFSDVKDIAKLYASANSDVMNIEFDGRDFGFPKGRWSINQLTQRALKDLPQYDPLKLAYDMISLYDGNMTQKDFDYKYPELKDKIKIDRTLYRVNIHGKSIIGDNYVVTDDGKVYAVMGKDKKNFNPKNREPIFTGRSKEEAQDWVKNNKVNFVRWDKLVDKKTRDEVANAANDAGFPPVLSDILRNNDQTGRTLYTTVTAALQAGGENFDTAKKMASDFLAKNTSVQGIMYPTDFAARGSHEDSFNYVVFDHTKVDITNKIKFQTGDLAKEVEQKRREAKIADSYSKSQSLFDKAYQSGEMPTDRGPAWDQEISQSLPDANFANMEEIKDLVTSKNFVILSGENPGGKVLPDNDNRAMNETAFQMLVNAGAVPSVVMGRYGGAELSFAMRDLGVNAALNIAEKLGQDQIATGKGLFYNNGTFHPVRRGDLEISDQLPEGNYTAVSVNGKKKYVKIGYDLDLTFKRDDLPYGMPVESMLTRSEGNDGYIFWVGDDGKVSSQETEGARGVFVPGDKVYPIEQDPYDVNYDGSVPNALVVVDNDGNVVNNPNIVKKQITMDNPKYAGMTTDGEGDFVFYHYAREEHPTIDPKYMGSSGLTTAAEESAFSAAKTAFFYTRPDAREKFFWGKKLNMVKVNPEKVYDVDADPDNLAQEAEKRFRDYIGNDMTVFDHSRKVAWITKLAGERGYEMSVADWGDPNTPFALRGHATKPLKTVPPNVYPSNYSKGWRTEYIDKNKKLDDLYWEMREWKGSRKEYDEIYTKINNAEFFGLSQDDITDYISDSNLPQDMKQRYFDILADESRSHSYKLEASFITKPKRIKKDAVIMDVAKKIRDESEPDSYENNMANAFIRKNITFPEFVNAMKESRELAPSVKQALRAQATDVDYARKIHPEEPMGKTKLERMNERAASRIQKGLPSGLFVSKDALADTKANGFDLPDNLKQTNMKVEDIGELINNNNGVPIILTSDMSRTGVVTYPDGSQYFEASGHAYRAIKQNVDNDVMWATSNATPLTRIKRTIIESGLGGKDVATFVNVQPPNSMLGNSGVDYTIKGLDELFKKKIITPDEYQMALHGIISSKTFFHKVWNIVYKSGMTDKQRLNATNYAIASINKRLHNSKGVEALHNFIRQSALDVRTEIISQLLGNTGKADNDISLYGNERKRFVIKKMNGDKVENYPSGWMGALLSMMGKGERRYTKKDFFENFADQRLYESWKNFEGISGTRSYFGMVVGGFMMNTDLVHQSGYHEHDVFKVPVPGHTPFRFEKGYDINKLFGRTYGDIKAPHPEGGTLGDYESVNVARGILTGRNNYRINENTIENAEVKYQQGYSKDDEVRIRAIADRYKGLPQEAVASEIAEKSNLSKETILKIMNSSPNADSQVKETRKTYANSDFSEGVKKSESDFPEVKEYVVRSQSLGDAEANLIIDKYGADKVAHLVIEPPEWLAGDVRVSLASKVFEVKEMEAKNEKDPEKKTAIYDNINVIRESLYSDLTKAGQFISAARVLADSSPEGFARGIDKKVRAETRKAGTEQGLTEEEFNKMRELKSNQLKAHPGLPKTKATQELSAYVQKTIFGHLKNKQKLPTVIESIWYSNILSGGSTHNRNIFANFMQWVGEMTTQSVKAAAIGDFVTPFKMLAGSFSGFRRGLGTAVYTQLYGTRVDKLDKTETLPILEWWRYDTGNKFVDKILDHSPWGAQILKHVGRLLSAGDAMFYHAGLEMRARQMAEKVARDNRRKKPKQQDYVRANEILHNNKESIKLAREQATEEGFTGKGIKGKLERSIRVHELIDQMRDIDIRKASDDFAARMTFNYEPEGMLGGFYRTWIHAADQHPTLKIFVPFAKIITNVTNRYIDWTPYGMYRSVRGTTKVGKGVKRKLSPDERADLAIKSMIGITSMFALAQASNDKDGFLEITGGLTNDFNKNYQIQESGVRKYSIHIKGTDKWYSYVDTPLFFLLAGIGTINDTKKYGNKDDELTQERMLEVATMGMMTAMSESSWMMGLSDMFKSIDPQRLRTGNKEVVLKTADVFMQALQSVAVGNWERQANRLWLEANEKPIKRAQFLEKFYRDIPYVQNSLGDIISAFGQPVVPTEAERVFNPFMSSTKVNPIAKLYTDNGVFVPREHEFDVIDVEKGEARTIQDDELYEFAAFRGKLITMLTERYMDMINSYDGDRKKLVLKEIINVSNKTAKAVMGLPKDEKYSYMDSLLEGKTEIPYLQGLNKTLTGEPMPNEGE